MKILIITAALILSAAGGAMAEQGQGKDKTVQTKVIEYKVDGITLRGYLAFPAEMKGRYPGILVFPEWWGVNDYPRRRAEELAARGYVALAADMYGDGKTTKDVRTAAAWSATLKEGDRSEMKKRAAAALAAIKSIPQVDPGKLAAIGYCFGGTVALELARSGADLHGIVAFHAGLDTPHPAGKGVIRPAILVCHGADDPYAPQSMVAVFQDEMRRSGADWQMIFYGDAVHSFSNPASGNDKSQGAAYNHKADRRSWEHMQIFFRELFGNVANLTAPQ